MSRPPEWLWATLSAALLSLVVGALAMWAGLPWLFPSLGPTIFLQIHEPYLESTRPYHVVVGHAAGVAAAAAGVLLAGAGDAPSVLSANLLTWPRVWASVIAMGGTLLLQVPLRASHPPAAATALLISLGGFRVAARDLGFIAAGVAIVTVLGEGARRLRVRQDDER